MTVNEALYIVLIAGAADTDAAGRVYPRADVAQSSARPYVVYRRVSGGRESLVGGGSANHAAGRWQVTVYADHQQQADAVIAAIMANCRQSHGSHPPPIRVIDIEAGPYDLPEMIEGAESQLAAIAIDIMVNYLEHQ